MKLLSFRNLTDTQPLRSVVRSYIRQFRAIWMKSDQPSPINHRPFSINHSSWTLIFPLVFWLCQAIAVAHASGPYEISIDDSPPPIGLGEIVAHVRDRETHQPPPDGKLMVKASMPSMPMGETWHKADPGPGHPGEFRLKWPFQMAGDWQIQAEFKGARGVADAAVQVSPGAMGFPLWARILLGIPGLGLFLFLMNLTRTPNGRERLKGLARGKNLVALLILILVGVGSWLLVRRQKAGQVDWNAMSMQMQDYTAPTPVSVQPVKYGNTSGVTTYTGTVAPYVEDTVYPRVTGRITLALYPGSPVARGQVLVRMEQPDLEAKAEQARFAVAGAGHDVLEAKDRVRQAQAAVEAARAMEQQSLGAVQEAEQGQLGAGGALEVAQSDLQSAIQEHAMAQGDLQAAQSAVLQSQAHLRSAQADAAYWQKEIPREAMLLAHGAVSRDEYQGELAKSQAAQAAVDAAAADVSHARAEVETARAKLSQAGDKIRSAQAQVIQARASQGGQAAKINQTRAAVQGARANTASAIHGAALAQDQVNHSYAMLSQARAAEAEAEANLGYLTIRASAPGVVTKRLADPGVVVSPGMGILKMAELDRVRLQANVSTPDLASIRTGTAVTVLVSGQSTPLHAAVTDLFPSANETTRTSIVEAVIPNPGRRLLPGEFVTMQFHSPNPRRNLVVPLSAVVNLAQQDGSGGQAGSGVWTTEDGKAHLVPVTLGASDGANQEVLGGLKEGDLVIVGGLEGLTEGADISYPGMPQFTSSSQAPEKKQASGLTEKAGDLSISLAFNPSPPRVGDNQLKFTLSDGGGAAVKGAAVQVTSEMPSMSMGGPSGTAKDNGDGTYTLPLMMGMGGDWRVTASINVPGKPAAKAVFNFRAG